MTAWLRETWVLAAAFALLAATWQLSMDPAIAATVSLQGKNLEHIVEQRPKDCPNWFARLAMENT